MHPKRISKWMIKPCVYLMGSNALQRSWLFESKSITQRIKKNHAFKLELTSEIEEKLDSIEKKLIGIASDQSFVRRVMLFADNKLFVLAKSIIPKETMKFGYSDLEKLGNKPLGDLIFTSKEFNKKNSYFAKFKINSKTYWGRITVFDVGGYPMSIREIFIIE
ncbi:MAG: chorismate lyase [Gammaproteobacteria bacterium]